MLVVFSAGTVAGIVPIVIMIARLAVCVKPLPVAVTRVPAGPEVDAMVTEVSNNEGGCGGVRCWMHYRLRQRCKNYKQHWVLRSYLRNCQSLRIW